MKNIVIIILAIAVIVLSILQIKSCSGAGIESTKTGVVDGQDLDKGEKIVIDFSSIPDTFSKLSGGRMVNFATAKAIISSNIPEDRTNPGFRDPNFTSSVFFSFEDILTLLKNHYKNPLPTTAELNSLGFRVYLGFYDGAKPDIVNYLGADSHLLGRPTVVLQLMSSDNKQFLFRKDVATERVTLNLGQLCPPDCPTGTIRTDDHFWVPSFP